MHTPRNTNFLIKNIDIGIAHHRKTRRQKQPFRPMQIKGLQHYSEHFSQFSEALK